MKKKTAKEILVEIIGRANAMTALTEANKDLSEQTKVIQKATALTLIEPAFGFMEESGSKDMKSLVESYKKIIVILQESGVLQTVSNAKEAISKIKEKNEKDNNTN